MADWRLADWRKACNNCPLVVTINCLEDPSLAQDALSGAAAVEHAPLSALTAGRLETVAAPLARASQHRLQPWQLLLCLVSPDRAADAELGLGFRLVHGGEVHRLKSCRPRRRRVHSHLLRTKLFRTLFRTQRERAMCPIRNPAS